MLNKPDILETASNYTEHTIQTTVASIVSNKPKRPVATGNCLSPLCGDQLEPVQGEQQRLFCNRDCAHDYEKYGTK